MVFKCQEDSFLKEYKGKVISCEKAEFNPAGLNESQDGYNVVLDETILFPDGGGQPCDHGTLNDQPVKNVIRDGSKAIHFVLTDKPFEIGQEVHQKIDWDRRMDHMQQHSGQHLITALFDQKYGYDTKSWWLGSETSYIELNAKDVTKEQLDMIENLSNKLIFEGKKVSVSVTSAEEGAKFQDLRAPRGLPTDHVGSVRVITIEDLESNMCCGTHVTNLSQLQVVKILHIEKAKNNLYVHFLVGNRVLKKLEACYNREILMNGLLKGGPSSHLELLQKLQSNLKITQKNFQKLLNDVAIFEAEKLKNSDPLPKYFCLHRNDGIERDFINTFLRNAPDSILYFLTVSDNSGKGHMVLRGDEKIISEIGNVFVKLLDGKGNGKGNLFQAKLNNTKKINECNLKLKEFFLD